MEGINGIAPVIKKIEFKKKGEISILLKDGRRLSVPLKYFPSLRQLDKKKLKKYHIVDDQIILFHDSNEVFHIEQFLGKEQNYRYHFI